MKDFSQIAIADVCEFITVGIVVKPTQWYSEKGIRCFRSQNVRENRVNDDGWVFISADGHRKHAKSKVREGDVLVVRTGAPGTSCVVPPRFAGSNCIDLVIARPLRDRLVPEYLSLFLNSEVGKEQVRLRSGGLAQQHLNVGALARVTMRLPSVDEQLRIVAIAQPWDRAARLLDADIDLQHKRRAALVSQLVTGRLRLARTGANGEIRTKFGSLPADWEYPKIGTLARQVTVKNSDATSRPVLSCTKSAGLVDSLSYFGRRVFSEDLSAYKVVRRGQFAYATNHAEEGSIGYQDSVDEGVISPMYTVFETSSHAVNDRFLILVLKTELYRHIFSVNTSASVDRRGGLRWDDFARIHVPLPPRAEQDAIVKLIAAADHEADLVNRLSNGVRRQKKGLMQRLFAGAETGRSVARAK